MDTKTKVEKYIKDWEGKCYKGGIPDEVESFMMDKAPNYKKICQLILTNDMNMTGLGYKPFSSKYYSVLKRIEIDARTYNGKQLKLF